MEPSTIQPVQNAQSSVPYEVICKSSPPRRQVELIEFPELPDPHDESVEGVESGYGGEVYELACELQLP